MARTLTVSGELDFDANAGFGYVRFRDAAGVAVDGAGGLDSLLTGFQHEGSDTCVQESLRPVLALIAEHGGRWSPGYGFRVRATAFADLRVALESFPESVVPKPTERASEVRIDQEPIALDYQVEIKDDVLELRAGFASGTKNVVLPADDVLEQAKQGSWVRLGSSFFRSPALGDDEAERLPLKVPERREGDAVPFFFAKQLEQLKKDARVRLGENAQRVRLIRGAWMPELDVKMGNEGRLHLDLSYAVETVRVTDAQTKASSKSQYIKTGKTTWVRNDKRKQADTADVLSRLPDLQPSETGGYDAPAFMLPLIQERFKEVGTIRLADSAQALREKLEDFSRIEPAPLPKGLRATLRSYQHDGYNWLYFLRKFGLRGVLADDMGLGKTVQTLAVVLAEVEAGAPEPALVVCPASVTNVWRAEVERWCSGLTPVVIGSDRRVLGKLKRGQIAIASYAALTRNAAEFQAVGWSYVVLDEAHKIKNPSAASTKACKGLLARHRLAVTGTPIQNRLAELWSLFDFLMPGYFGPVRQFEREYEVPITNRGDKEAAARLKRRIDPFKLRREKSQVAKDLPPLTQQVLQVPMLDKQRELYEGLVRTMAPAAIKELEGGAKGANFLEKLLRLRQAAAHPRLIDRSFALLDSSGKFESMTELLEASLDNQEKVLIFSQWTSMTAMIEEYLSNKGISFCAIDGSTTREAREKHVGAFQGPGGPSVMVLSLLAGGEGITLTAANVVIMFDRWWNPALEDQAIARAHRIGQTKRVMAYILEAKGTVEERLADLLRRKRTLSDEIITIDDAAKQLTREDLLSVLKEELAAVTRA